MEKTRLVVLNNQKIIETCPEGKWETKSVSPAGSLRAGIYNISSAQDAPKNKNSIGMVLHIDESKIYQESGNGLIVAHDKRAFDTLPSAIGAIGRHFI